MSTKLDLATEIARKTGLKQEDVKQVVQMALDAITEALASERRLELRNFGVFEVRVRKARMARNPGTGEKVTVPARKKVTFKVGKVMEERVLGPAGGTGLGNPPGGNTIRVRESTRNI
jgi:nucleoid DNA-binding protein